MVYVVKSGGWLVGVLWVFCVCLFFFLLTCNEVGKKIHYLFKNLRSLILSIVILVYSHAAEVILALGYLGYLFCFLTKRVGRDHLLLQSGEWRTGSACAFGGDRSQSPSQLRGCPASAPA